jgi:hypothetical protein
MAALLSPRPQVRVYGCDDATATSLLADLEPRLGPLPQAELLLHLEDDDGELRITLPGLDLDAWLPVSRVLSALGRDFALVGADAAPREEARLQGTLVTESIHRAGIVAVRHTADGSPSRPDLTRHPATHPDVVELVADVVARLDAALGAGSVLEEATRVVVRRRDGRTGLQLVLRDPAPPEILDVLGDLVRARAGSRDLRIAPDVDWDPANTLRLWLLLTHLAPLPVGDPGAHGSVLDPGPLSTAIRVVASPSLPVAAVAQHWPELRGDEGRWCGRSYVPTWVAEQVRELPLPVQQLPDGLPGLEPHRAAVTLHPHRSPSRWFVRVRDRLQDRDLLEDVTPRPADDRDRDRVDAVFHAAQRADLEPVASDRWVRTLEDGQGRPGLAILLQTRSVSAEGSYRAALDALGAVTGFEPVATVALTTHETVTVHLWYPGHPVDGTRPWVAV